MIRVIDTYKKIRPLLKKDFNKDKWVTYADSIYPSLFRILIDDIKAYDFEKDCLSVINYALNNEGKIKEGFKTF